VVRWGGYGSGDVDGGGVAGGAGGESRVIDVDAIRQRAENATPGPWRWSDKADALIAEGESFETIFNLRLVTPTSRADAEFIAHAREDIPALLAEVTRLSEENQRLRDDLETLREQRRAAGRKGGKRSLETMTPEERTERARTANKARRDAASLVPKGRITPEEAV
jgi:hypothetical protein